MKHTKKLFLAAAFAVASTNTASAVVLAEVTFAGTAGTNIALTIGSGNSQFTVKSSLIDFTGTGNNATFLNSVSGTQVTAPAWTYATGGNGAFNNDLHNASTFGGPTRFDLSLGLATTGNTYSIDYAEIDVASSVSSPTFEMTYRLGAAAPGGTQTFGGSTLIASSAGTATYRINLTGLSVTDTTRTYDNSGTGRLRLNFFEGDNANADGLNISAVRVGMVPEPSAALLGALGGLLLLRRGKR